MRSKKHRLFRLDSFWFGDWLWAAVTLGPTALIAKAIHYNYADGRPGLPFGAWVAFAAVLLAFWGITIWRYVNRARFIRSVVFYTKHGMAVTLHGRAAELLPRHGEFVLRTGIDEAIDAALNFFAKHVARTDLTTIPLAGGLDGGVLSIVDAPFRVGSIHGPLPATLGHKLMGISYLNRIVVAAHGPTWDDLNALLGLIKHEAGHYALTQLGTEDVNGEAHHALYQKLGFNF